ncbi:hypothetical protein DPMN_045481 [Dreissena polymorpha]|uniref:Uncharacterized protein n=1 Tax=Dreissena polymorpha TaxID=45954 RepID=A0A9D4D4F9_DREPO|nr:hypothetical protein DPMN_045481 [Dreissena polymorpha]
MKLKDNKLSVHYLLSDSPKSIVKPCLDKHSLRNEIKSLWAGPKTASKGSTVPECRYRYPGALGGVAKYRAVDGARTIGEKLFSTDVRDARQIVRCFGDKSQKQYLFRLEEQSISRPLLCDSAIVGIGSILVVWSAW